MAINTGNSSRKGAVKNRTQYFDGNCYKVRDKETGQFIRGGKSEPYKGIKIEKNNDTNVNNKNNKKTKDK